MDERTMNRFLAAAAHGDPQALARLRQVREAQARGRGMHPAAVGVPGAAPPVVPHSTIQADQIHPPDPGTFVHSIMAPSRILVMPGIPSVPADSVSTQTRLEFSAGGGWLIGFRGSAIDYTPGAQAAGNFEQANMGLRLFINDGEDIITNGVGVDHARFSDLFPPTTVWSPILRRMDVKDNLFATFRNFNPAGEGAPALQPSLTFLFWREKYPGTS